MDVCHFSLRDGFVINDGGISTSIALNYELLGVV
jgi:hypothetical protein